ncbi:MAG: DUF6146 family protein [Bacteroidota bacterium]
MKKLIYLFITVLIIYSCDTSKSTTEKSDIERNTDTTESKQDTIRIANDELEYEIIIIDVGFESWLVTQKPMSYYGLPYLENKNYFYVVEWNQRVLNPHRYDPMLYEQQIDYDPNIDYGKEVNYKLYMYFEFFQKKYNQKLR